MSDHSWDFVEDKQILVGPCLLTKYYLEPFLGNREGGCWRWLEDQKN